MNARKTCYIVLVIALAMSLPMWAGAQGEPERTVFTGNFFNCYGSQWLRFNTADFIEPGGDDAGWVGEPGVSMFFKGTTIWGGTIETPCTLSNLLGDGVLRASWPQEVYSVVVTPCPDDETDEVPSCPAVVTVYKPWDCGFAAGGKLILYSGCPPTPRCASFGMLFQLPPTMNNHNLLGTPVETRFYFPCGNPVRLLLEDPCNPDGPVTIWALNSFTATATAANTVTGSPSNGGPKVTCIELCGRAWFKQGDEAPRLDYLKAKIFWDSRCCCWKFQIKLTQYPNTIDYCEESCIYCGGVFACLPRIPK